MKAWTKLWRIHYATSRRNLCLAVVLMIVACIVLAAIYYSNISSSNGRSDDAREYFIPIDFVEVVSSSVVLPFTYEIGGENNSLKIVLCEIERVYAHNESVEVVLHGKAWLCSKVSAVEVECEAALRYSFQIGIESGQSLICVDRKLGKLSVYMENSDVEALIERGTMGFWRAFEQSLNRWECDICAPFQTDSRVAVKADGVFVFEK